LSAGLRAGRNAVVGPFHSTALGHEIAHALQAYAAVAALLAGRRRTAIPAVTMSAVGGATQALLARLLPPAQAVPTIAVLGTKTFRLAIERLTGPVATVTIRRARQRSLARIPIASIISTETILGAKGWCFSLFQFTPAIATSIACATVGQTRRTALPDIDVTDSIAAGSTRTAIGRTGRTGLSIFRAAQTIAAGSTRTAILRAGAAVFPLCQITGPISAIGPGAGPAAPRVTFLYATDVPTVDATERV